jgi:hypothetical protein
MPKNQANNAKFTTFFHLFRGKLATFFHLFRGKLATFRNPALMQAPSWLARRVEGCA